MKIFMPYNFTHFFYINEAISFKYTQLSHKTLKT